MNAIELGSSYLGTARDGVTAMAMIEALYASARAGRPAPIAVDSLART